MACRSRLEPLRAIGCPSLTDVGLETAPNRSELFGFLAQGCTVMGE